MSSDTAAQGGAAGSGGAMSGLAGAGGLGEGGAYDPRCDDPAALPPQPIAPPSLGQAGLYADMATRELSSRVREFRPAYELWSDGSSKRRWIDLPNCSIDTRDMDHWDFPVGTRLFKEFAVRGVPIETRLLHRFGPGPSDWLLAAYQWNDSLSDALHVPDGVVDAAGSSHDIPPEDQCISCHVTLPEWVLGFSAVQLSHDGAGETLASLGEDGRLTRAAAAAGHRPPGDALTRAALGYLHGNCGNCHQPTMAPFTHFSLRLLAEHSTLEQTFAWRQGINEAPSIFSGQGITHRIAPGDPSASAVSFLMGQRGPSTQMPPLGTERIDDDGMGIVNAWISSLPPDAGD
jgi:hypothetical protein